MSQSYNEVEALIKRAARGVRQPWGMADESAKAARWLVERGFSGADTMLQLLDLYDTHAPVKPIVDNAEWSACKQALLCPVITGTALADFSVLLAQHGRIKIAELACPLLILPFAAQASLITNHCLSVHWHSFHCLIDGNRIATQLESNNDDTLDKACYADSASGVVEVSDKRLAEHLLVDSSLQEKVRVERASVDQYCWTRLTTLAHRTYAPASEESRRLGAGAGNSDND